MGRLVLIAVLLFPSVAFSADRIFVFGASDAGGYPYSTISGNSIAGTHNPRVFADHISAQIGPTPTGLSYTNNMCLDSDTCSSPGGPPNCSPYPSVCDLATSGSLVNSTQGQDRIPFCNDALDTGSCNATSQVSFAVTEIAASAVVDEIKALVLIVPFIANDGILVCNGFVGGSLTFWNYWKAGLTTGYEELRAAVDASLSPDAVIIAMSEARYWHQTDDDEYWTYSAGRPQCSPPEPVPTFGHSNWGGVLSEANAFMRALAATHSVEYVDFATYRYVGATYDRYRAGTMETTDPSECGVGVPAGRCDSWHYNNWGHTAQGNAIYLKYLLATSATDSDGDGLPNAYETLIGTNTSLADTDGDGCSDGVEVGGIKQFGGARDPNSAFDFFDVNGDLKVDNNDINLLRSRVFLGVPSRKYDSTFQRLPALTYSIGDDPDKKDAWDFREVVSGLAAPNDRPTIEDLQLMFIQLGDRCDCLPDYSDCKLADGAVCQDDIQCSSETCGCGGGAQRDRTCQPATGVTGSHSEDQRKCTGLAQFRSCILAADCSSGTCNDSVVPGYKACVGN